MSLGLPQRPYKFKKRIFGTTAALAPLILLIVSIVFGVLKQRQSNSVGIGCMVAAFAVALINFYLSFVRPLFFRFRNGSMNNFRFISGIPIVGTILIVLGALFGFGSVGVGAIGLLPVALDTGGSGWFLIATWKDGSLWEK